MLELNNESWTIFSGIKNLHTAFIYSLLRAKSELSNGKIIMPVLLYEDKIVASVFGYINRRKCYLHTAGIKRYKIRSLAPGITMYILLIRSLIEMKIKILDLSPGIEEYKIRLNGKVQVITQVVIFKNKISMLIYKTSLSILKTMKKF
jgi:CelD/BcsL family acetyltransferase involved in cellulose biosynthesis